MAEGEAEAVRRRRSKSRSSSRKKDSGWMAYWRSNAFGRHLFIGMTILAAAYAGMILYQTRQATRHYHGLALGDSESQIRYVMGPPRATDPARSEYVYEEEGRQIRVGLTPDNRLASVSCTSQAGLPSSCPGVRGIVVGDIEDEVIVKLGSPTGVSYPGNDKVLHYEDLGLDFTLRRYRLLAIELHRGAGISGYVPRALWAMVP